MRPDYTKIHRLLRLIFLIKGHRGITKQDLLREFHTNPKTLQRDIKTLRDLGVPILYDKERGGYLLGKGFFMPPVEFTFDEALSLLTLLQQIPADDQIPHLATARRALQKIRSHFRDQLQDDLAPLDGKIHLHLARNAGNDGSADVYEKVRLALASRRTLSCRYQANHSAHEEAETELFELRPYALWYCQRAYYVVGLHCGRNDIRQLKLARFDYMQLTPKPYAIPDDFSLTRYLGNAWRMIRGPIDHRVLIRFDKDRANTATETHWHPTQSEEAWHEDGSVTLAFTVSSFKEIKWHILAYGPHAQVLHPPELANEVQALAQATARRYTAEP
jgi:predicted DNA-binding transcriptional regulator YafY